MCECGCGELRPLAKLPAPGGGWYAFEVYAGCQNCRSDFWGVSVTLFKKGDEDADVVLRGVERITFDKHSQWNKVILDYDVLRKRFALHGGEDELAEPDVAPMFVLNEMLRAGDMTSVFYDTLKKGDEERRSLIQRGASVEEK